MENVALLSSAYVAVKQVGGVGFQQKVVETQAEHHLLAHSSSNNTKLGSRKNVEKPDTVRFLKGFIIDRIYHIGFLSIRR